MTDEREPLQVGVGIEPSAALRPFRRADQTFLLIKADGRDFESGALRRKAFSFGPSRPNSERGRAQLEARYGAGSRVRGDRLAHARMGNRSWPPGMDRDSDAALERRGFIRRLGSAHCGCADPDEPSSATSARTNSITRRRTFRLLTEANRDISWAPSGVAIASSI